MDSMSKSRLLHICLSYARVLYSGAIGACGGGTQRAKALPCPGAPLQQQRRLCRSAHPVAGMAAPLLVN